MSIEPTIEALPNPLLFADGTPVVTPEAWRARRAELLEMMQEIEYGHLPPAPEKVAAYLLYPSYLKRCYDANSRLYKLTMTPADVSFSVTVVTPVGKGPWPVIVNGDGCWRYLTDEILRLLVQRGYAVAYFNRVELAPDNYTNDRSFGLYATFPDRDFGALAAWAWGYHRVIDFLHELPEIDTTRIAVSGHSRGGKAALLAGATDERVALTAPNDSGSGGAGCLRFPDEGGEQVSDLIKAIAYWFSPRLRDYVGREHELPFDQHSVKALVAPRALLTTEARGDIWASPQGTRLTHEAAREVYRLLGVEERIGIHYREGEHSHLLEDWEALLDFADLQFYQKPTMRNFDARP